MRLDNIKEYLRIGGTSLWSDSLLSMSSFSSFLYDCVFSSLSPLALSWLPRFSLLCTFAILSVGSAEDSSVSMTSYQKLSGKRPNLSPLQRSCESG